MSEFGGKRENVENAVKDVEEGLSIRKFSAEVPCQIGWVDDIADQVKDKFRSSPQQRKRDRLVGWGKGPNVGLAHLCEGTPRQGPANNSHSRK